MSWTVFLTGGANGSGGKTARRSKMEVITNNQSRNLEHIISMGVRKAIENSGISRERARELLDSMEQRNDLREFAEQALAAVLKERFGAKEGIIRQAG